MIGGRVMSKTLMGANNGFRDTEVLWENQKYGEKHYNKQRKKFGLDWYYYDKKITFKYNKEGFRASDFSTVDWANSVVVFGDSYTTGDGNAIEDIVTTHLQKLLGMPVINLGVSGSGIDYNCWNSVILYDHYPHPKAIVHLWSGIDRYSEHLLEPVLRFDRFQPNKKDYCTDHDWQFRNKFYVQTDRALWKNKLPYYEATPFAHTAKDLEIDLIEEFDRGRDLDHWGYKTHQLAAETIATNLRNQGLTI